MKTRITYLFLICFFIAGNPLSGQATLTEDLGNENDIRTAVSEIVITLTGDKFDGEIATDGGAASDFLDGMSGGSDSWDALVATLDETNIRLNGDSTVATIDLPAYSNYYIGSNDSILFTIPSASLMTGGSGIAVSPKIAILNLQASVTEGNELNTDLDESDLWSQSRDYSITLANNAWITVNLLSELDLVKGMFSAPAKFQAMVEDLVLADIDVTGNVMTISFDANSSYYIPDDEVVSVTVPNSLLKYTETIAAHSLGFTINNEDPEISITDQTFSESDVRSGLTFDISLSGDEWESSLTSTFGDSVASGGVWDSDIVRNISREDGSTVRVTTVANSSFDISSNETVVVEVAAKNLRNTNTGSFAASGSKTITFIPPSVSASGSIDGVYEDYIRGSSTTIVFSLEEDTWHANVGGNYSETRDLLNAITCSPAQTGFNDLIAQMTSDNNGAPYVTVNAAGTEVTINVPSREAFNITETISLDYDIPASTVNSNTVLNGSVFATINRREPSMVIEADRDPLKESELGVALLKVKLFEETFTGIFDKDNFILQVTPANSGPEDGVLDILNDADIHYVDDDSIYIELSFNGSYSEEKYIRLQILAAELTDGLDLLSDLPAIRIEPVIEPNITGVIWDNSGKGIGDLVIATVTVDDDKGENFEYEGGTIAGRIIDSINPGPGSETYNAYFTLSEGGDQYAADASIDVIDLQFNNGVILGNQFTGSIDLDRDTIDTERPHINLVSFNNGKYGIGETVTATISTTEGDLRFVNNSTSINGHSLNASNLNSYNAGAGIYQLSYTVLENDQDRKDLSSVPISVVFRDVVGNENTAVTSYTGADPEIDAHSPVISSLTITNAPDIITPGEAVYLLVSAGEDDLTIDSTSAINKLSLLTGDISFTPQGSGNYLLTYIVGEEDDEVAAGGLKASVTLIDEFGNAGSKVNDITNANNISIVTSKATGFIFGDGEICLGDSAEIFVSIEGGTGPYDIEVVRNGFSDTLILNAPAEFSFYRKPGGDVSYTIQKVTDDLGIIGNSSGSADIVVHELPDAEFDIASRTVFSLGGSAYLLEADPDGGFFSGPGVIPAEERFYPGIAGVSGPSGHDIIYTVENVYGCVDSDTLNVEVLETSGQVVVNTDFSHDGVICYNDPNISVEGSNIVNYPGTFKLFRRDISPFTKRDTLIEDSDALIVDATNQAHIVPSLLEDASYSYIVEYTYFWKGSDVTESAEFDFDYIRPIEFDITVSVCSDSSLVELKALPEEGGTFKFEGTGVGGNAAQGYTFNPAAVDALLGTNTLLYEFKSNKGCVRTDTWNIENYDVPEVKFRPFDVCIARKGGSEIQFENLTNKESIIASYAWDFGEPNAPRNYFDTTKKTNPVHLYASTGSRTVSLEIVTLNNCTAEYDTLIVFAEKPKASFRWKTDCFVDEDTIFFINESSSVPQWNSFKWNIYDSNMNFLDSRTLAEKDALDYIFGERSTYNLELIAINDADTINDLVCRDTMLRSITLQSTIDLSKDHYFEDFNENNGSWTAWADTNFVEFVNSFTYGVPDFNGYRPESNNLAWYTMLEKKEERSWMQSPCFDFSGLERPMIRFDIMKSFDQNRDGALLQYKKDTVWVPVGNIGEGINWYNAYNIQAKPGSSEEDGEGIGWSGGTSITADTNWVEVAHDLDELIGNKSVVFGLFYATDGVVTSNEGVAFDNVYLGERTKRALIEHFTNASDPKSEQADAQVFSFSESNALDVTSLYYHMNYPGIDSIYMHNPSPASSRSFFYGVNEVPFALMDGGVKESYVYDFTPSFPSNADMQNLVQELTLESPLFGMEVDFQLYSNRLAATVDLRALTDIDSTMLSDVDSMEIVLSLAVVEKDVSSYAGRSFKNVVLDMLPSPAGKVIFRSWQRDDLHREHYSWYYENVEDHDELMLVAFVQDRSSGKVLQVVSSDMSNFIEGVYASEIQDLRVFPNPVKFELFVRNSVPAEQQGRLEVFDMTGRLLLQEEIFPGDFEIRLNTSSLTAGPYILTWEEAGYIKARTSFIKVQ